MVEAEPAHLTAPAPSAPGARFNLVRRLSIVAVLGLLLTAGLLLGLYWYDQSKEHQELLAQHNEESAERLIQVLGNQLIGYPARMEGLDPVTLHLQPEVALLDAELTKFLDTRLLKIKLYGPAGIAVYSSVHDEIGIASRNREALNRALHGEIQHKMEYREVFRTHRGDLPRRQIIQTYLPLHAGDRVAGVFELYSDITPAMERARYRLVVIAMVVFAAFGALHLALFFSMRRADQALVGWQDAIAASARQIALAEARLRAMLQTALDGVIAIDPQGRLIEFNAAAESTFGWPREEVLGKPVQELIIPERFRAPHLEAVNKFLAAGHDDHRRLNHRIEIIARRRNGEEFPVELSISSIDEGGTLLFIAYVRDITERKRSEEELRVAAIAFDSQECMFITDTTGIIQRVNRAFVDTTGYTAAEAVGHTPGLLRSGRHTAEFYQQMWQQLQRDGFWQGEIWNRRKSGEIFPEWLTITAVKNAAGKITHHVATFSDITRRKAAEEEIRHLAFYDPLTRLPNRRLLLDRLQQALATSIRTRRHGALLFIDLDNFKRLNDTLGHDMGDRLLQQVAVRLNQCVRSGDTIARQGGDEFVVMLKDLSEEATEAAAQAEVVGKKILDTLGRPYSLAADGDHHSTPSIGVALFLGRSAGIDELLRRADLAMYEAKAAGRNTLRFFDPKMQAAMVARSQLEHDLRLALQRNELLLYYQPQVDAEDRQVGAEALVRWQHPERGLLLPDNFIPLAEETGLILPLGDWVLRAACAKLAEWAADPAHADLVLSVNISARQFRQDDFVARVLAALEHSGADPQHLKLELTESLLLDSIDSTVSKLAALKEHGIGLSLDDFGTGYSSLAYLRRLPLDQLKIDRSFVEDVLTDPNDAAIVRAIVVLGHSLGLTLVAEGVENEAQRDFLAAIDCRIYQGYLFGKPVAEIGGR